MAYRRTARRRKAPKKAPRRATRVAAPLVRRVVMNMAEKKYFENTILSSTTVGTTWMFHSALAGITQGTAAYNRIGNKIFVHSIKFMVYITPNANEVASSNIRCRCAIYHNKEAVGALPTGSAVFTSDSIFGLRYQPLLSRYTIVKDTLHTMVAGAQGNAANTYALGPQGQFVVTVYPKKRIDFSSNAGTISDLFKDDYGMCCVSSNTTQCNMSVWVQVIFSDA